MNQSDKFQESLDAYLLGELKGDALTAFEALIASNPDLARELQEAEEVQKGLMHFGNEQMRERLQRIKKEALEQPKEVAKVRSLNLFRIVASVAAIGLLLIVAYLFLLKAPSPQQLFAQNYQPYPISLSARDVNSPDLIAPISQAYQRGQYQEALQNIQPILESEKYDKQLLLVAGICAMETDQEKLALSYFQQLIDRQDALYADQAQWYSALIFLQQDKVSQAKTHLQNLSQDPAADHHQEALDLLKKLP